MGKKLRERTSQKDRKIGPRNQEIDQIHKEVARLVDPNKYFKPKEKNEKMPINMLRGIRKKAVERYKREVEQRKEDQIHYDSAAKQLKVGFYLEKKREKAFKNLRTDEKSYKFLDAKPPKTTHFNYKKGVLHVDPSVLSRNKK